MSSHGLAKYMEDPRFVRGVLHRMVVEGHAPQYGYHANHLPETRGEATAVETMFLIAHPRAKKADRS